MEEYDDLRFQEPPEAMVYLDARSQCGSTHGSTSDDTGSSMSTVVDRFSTSDRVSTISTASTASTGGSEQLTPSEISGIDRDSDRLSDRDVLLSRAICPLEHLERDFSNPPDYLLRRLASSEAVTHVESRGEVERITAVVAPNTVLIEETITLQPPLSFQDAPLSYGHETRPDLFYTADLAADSTTHFRPIKDDAELVEHVNGSNNEKYRDGNRTVRSNTDRSSSPSPPPLPARNHVNRICVNQARMSESENDAQFAATMPVSHDDRELPDAPLLPPKPLPRKDVKARRKRPPPPPPPPIITPRREVKSSVESNHVEKEDRQLPQVAAVVEQFVSQPDSDKNLSSSKSDVFGKNRETETSDENIESELKNDCLDTVEKVKNSEEDAQINKVFEIIEIRVAKGLQSDQEEITRNESDITSETTNCEQTGVQDEGSKSDQLQSANNLDKISSSRPNSNSEPAIEGNRVNETSNETKKHIDSENQREDNRLNDRDVRKETFSSNAEDILSSENSTFRESENDGTYRSLDEVNDDMRTPEVNRMLEDEETAAVEEEDTTDESDDGDYYWQSNLATIGEEEETTSLEYANA